MDYLSHLRRCLTDPLVTRGADGARQVIDLLDEYDLLREDFDNILEASTWPGQRNPMDSVESKVNLHNECAGDAVIFPVQRSCFQMGNLAPFPVKVSSVAG